MGHNYSSLQLTLTFKTHTKHAKMHEMYKLFIFVVVLSPVSVGWRWGVNNGAHLFQSTADIDFKTHTKHAKMHEMYKLFIFAAVLSAAAKLRRLAICIIYKFKYKNSNTHTSMEAPPRPDMFGGGGESFKMAALLSEWCERLWNWATTVDTCHVLHLHTNTIGIFVNFTLLI